MGFKYTQYHSKICGFKWQLSKLYWIGSTEYTEHFKEIIKQHDGTFTIVS